MDTVDKSELLERPIYVEPSVDVTIEAHPVKLSRAKRIGLAIGGLGLALSTHPASPASAEAENPDAERAQAAVTLVIETYNILGSNHTGKASAVRRAKLSAKIIKGNAGAPAADIVGFQEMEPDQRRLFETQLPGYDAFPDKGKINNSIFFDKSEFNFIAGGVLKYPYYGDSYKNMTGSAPWVLLESKDSGKKVAVSNWHAVAFSPNPGWDNGGAFKRRKTALIASNWVDAVEENVPDAATFVIGDLNSTNVLRTKPDKYTPKVKDRALNGDRSKLPYCILTQEPSELQNTRDMMNNNRGRCPENRQKESWRYIVDWVFAEPDEVTVMNWRQITNLTAKRASDHPPLVVNTKIHD